MNMPSFMDELNMISNFNIKKQYRMTILTFVVCDTVKTSSWNYKYLTPHCMMLGAYFFNKSVLSYFYTFIAYTK